MRRVWITRVGPPSVLVLKDDPDPVPSAGTVRIRVQRSGVNFADVLMRLGVYPGAPALPAVIGYEVSGVVDAIGPEIQTIQVGDRVVALCPFGGYADTVLVSERFVFPIPESMTFSQAAAVPVTYLTAYQMLVGVGRIKDSDTVLVHSAGGGVGLAVIDLCRILGAKVIGIASRSKHQKLRDCGVTALVDSREEDLAVAVRKLAGEKGVSLILDPSGPASWSQSLSLLAAGGRLCVFGNSAIVIGNGENMRESVAGGLIPMRLDPMRLISENKGVFGVHLGRLWNDRHVLAEGLEQVFTWYREGFIRPVISAEFPLAQAGAAHQYLQDRQNFGKVLLDCQILS